MHYHLLRKILLILSKIFSLFQGGVKRHKEPS